jgi:ligand-binding sensor protein/archaellum component FlaC
VKNLKLTDLIDIKTLQEIQDSFSKATGMAALTTDADGNPITKGSNFTDFCMNFTRKSAAGIHKCEKCDRDGGLQSSKMGKAVAYQCHSGLYDFAAPIIVDGKMIGSFIGGQVLPEPPDLNKFRKIAVELGIDPEEYINAVKKVKVIPKQQIEAAADFLYVIAKVLSSIAYSNLHAKETNTSLVGIEESLKQKIISMDTLTRSTAEHINELDKSFSELKNIAENSVAQVNTTNDTVKVIQDIAMNTRILGFNASIEASRSKESGKGFGVIAQEVRNLAETSKSSADKIQVTMKKISEFTEEIDEQVKKTEKMVEGCYKNLEEITEFLNELKETVGVV